MSSSFLCPAAERREKESTENSRNYDKGKFQDNDEHQSREWTQSTQIGRMSDVSSVDVSRGK